MVAGIFFLLTEITAIGAIFGYGAVVSDPNYILTGSASGNNGVFLGALFELLLAVANVGTAVTLFPVVKRQNESIALGYVCGRLAEGLVIIVGVVGPLAVVTLRHDLGGGDWHQAQTPPPLALSARLWLGYITDVPVRSEPHPIEHADAPYLMFSSRLVPRFIAVLGLTGGSLIFVSGTAVVFGVYTQGSTVGLIAESPCIRLGGQPRPLAHL